MTQRNGGNDHEPDVEVHIGEGGLLRWLEISCHLTSLPAQIAVVVLLTWAPIVVLGLVSERATGGVVPVLHDPVIHVRLLVATPALLYLDHVFPRACRRTLIELVRQGFIPAAERDHFDQLLRRAARRSDSWVPEVLLALFGLGIGVAALLGLVPASGIDPRTPWTLAEVWYALAALSLFEFLLLRSLWRWVIWVRILVGLARIPLDLDPMHPDCRGGISFLRRPSLSYCVLLLFVIASVLCAEWSSRYTLGSTISSYVLPLLGFALAGTLLAFGPLLAFVPQLARTRREGLAELSGLAAASSRSFRRTWREPPERARILTDPEVQGLAALGVSYRETVSRLQVVLFVRRDLITVVIATLVPMVPLMLTSVPHEDWLAMLRKITGSLP